MSQLPDDARAAFARARSAYSPSPEQLARLRTRIAATLADAGNAPDQTLDLPGHAAPRSPSWYLPGPWLAAPVLLGALTAALYLGLRSAPSAPPGRSSSPAPVLAPSTHAARPTDALRQPDQDAAHDASRTRAVEAAVPSAAGADTHVPPARRRSESRPLPAPRDRSAPEARSAAPRAAAAVAAPLVAPADVPEASPAQALAGPAQPAHTDAPTLSVARVAAPDRAEDSLREEVALLRAARGALEQDDVAAADAALARHRLRFAVGQLRLERVALEVWSSCARGDSAAARARYRELSLLSPAPGLGAGIRERCGELLR